MNKDINNLTLDELTYIRNYIVYNKVNNKGDSNLVQEIILKIKNGQYRINIISERLNNVLHAKQEINEKRSIIVFVLLLFCIMYDAAFILIQIINIFDNSMNNNIIPIIIFILLNGLLILLNKLWKPTILKNIINVCISSIKTIYHNCELVVLGIDNENNININEI